MIVINNSPQITIGKIPSSSGGGGTTPSSPEVHGRYIPIVKNNEQEVLLKYDTLTNTLVGEGVKNEIELIALAKKVTTAQLSELGLLQYTGSNEKIPLIIDANKNVLAYFDTTKNEFVSSGGQSGYVKTDLLALPDELKPQEKAVNTLIGYGQSLSVGAVGTPVLSTSQPYKNITFNGGPRGFESDYSKTIPLVEDTRKAPDGGTNRGETFCSGAANHAVTLAIKENNITPESHVIFASTAGKGGTAIDNLIKGSDWYKGNLTNHLSNSVKLNRDSAIHAVMWAQGETDLDANSVMSLAEYQKKLSQLRVDIETDAKALTKQTSPTFLITYQTSYLITKSTNIAFAQLALAKTDEKVFLATPCYHLPFASDQTHLTNIGYKMLGAYMGRVYKTLVIDKAVPRFINPINATSQGNKVTLRFDVPVKPLVIDHINLASTQDSGFQVSDSKGVVPLVGISAASDTVTITLSRALETSPIVSYATKYLAPTLKIKQGASGNLRDSEPDSIFINGEEKSLFNVCPHFELNIVKLGD